MIHLNTSTDLDARTLGLAKEEAKKRKANFCFKSGNEIHAFNLFDKLKDEKVILFDQAHLAPIGYTENPVIVDLVNALDANGVEVYINAADGSHIAKEFLAKTACKLVREKR